MQEKSEPLNAVLGIVSSLWQGDRLTNALTNAGFARGDVSILFPETPEAPKLALENEFESVEGAAVGAISGIEALLATGPLLSALRGVATRPTSTALTAALVALDVPEVAAKHLQNKVKRGSLLVAVHVEGKAWRQNVARNLLQAHGATDVVVAGEMAVGRSLREVQACIHVAREFGYAPGLPSKVESGRRRFGAGLRRPT